MGTTNNPETVEYRVALADSSWPLVMVEATPEGYCLPRVRIPKRTRPAEEINEALRRDWQLNTLILSILHTGDERPACAVAEVLPSAKGSFPRDLTLQNIELVGDSELDLSERFSIRTVFAGDASTAGPFSRRGWLKEAQSWIRTSVPQQLIEFSGDFRQYNTGETFALVQLGTRDGNSYWLKATGEPNKHECRLTVELSRLFPEHLPKLIAVREDWNAWVTVDAGQTLRSIQRLDLLIGAVEALADLQIRSLDHISRLQTVGCINRSLTALQSHLPEMFAFLEDAMRQQTSMKVKPLESRRLHEIEAAVRRACQGMREFEIPDCLVNGDINLDNILFDESRFSFTDWAEGGIGNPFLTLQQVIQHVIREEEHLDWVGPICQAYKKRWLGLLTEHQINSAFALMPLLTMADYLYGRGDWLNLPRRDEPSLQSFARTLGRCMDRAAVALSSAEVL